VTLGVGVLVAVLVCVTVGVGVFVGDGVGVFVAEIGGNTPSSTKDTMFLNDGAIVYVPSITHIFLV
jgi:hypothetical protein